MHFFQTHKTGTILFFVSFVVHLAVSVFLFSKFHENILYFENEDAYGYVDLAKSVVSGHGFSRDGVPSVMRTPAWPLALAVVMETRLPFAWSVILLHNVFASLGAVLLYEIGSKWLSRKTGFIAGYLYALEPYMLMTANLGTTETFFNFLLILFLFLFLRVVKKNETGERNRFFLPLASSAIAFGIATLTRPVTLFAPIAVLIIFFVQYVRKKISLNQLCVQSIVWLAVFVAVIAPWSIRDFVHYRTFRITNIDANMMYYRIAPIVVSHQQHVSYTSAISLLRDRISTHFQKYDGDHVNNDFAYYDYLTGETRRLVFRDPGIVAKYYALSLIPALTGTGYEYILESVFDVARRGVRANYTELLLSHNFSGYVAALSSVDVLQAALLFGALAWAVAYLFIIRMLLRKEVWRAHGIILFTLILFAGYFIFFSLGPQVHARYRMPTLPFLYLLLALSIDVYVRLRCHSRI